MAWRILFRTVWILGAVALGWMLSREPWKHQAQQEAKRDAAVVELQATQQAKIKVLEEKARYGSSVGREELARERGYMKANEKRLELGN